MLGGYAGAIGVGGGGANTGVVENQWMSFIQDVGLWEDVGGGSGGPSGGTGYQQQQHPQHQHSAHPGLHHPGAGAGAATYHYHDLRHQQQYPTGGR
jgi:hypothetical protein